MTTIKITENHFKEKTHRDGMLNLDGILLQIIKKANQLGLEGKTITEAIIQQPLTGFYLDLIAPSQPLAEGDPAPCPAKSEGRSGKPSSEARAITDNRSQITDHRLPITDHRSQTFTSTIDCLISDRESYSAIVKSFDKTIEAFQDLCDHPEKDQVFIAHGHDLNIYKCTHCLKTIERR